MWITYDIRELEAGMLVPSSTEELHLTFVTQNPNTPILYSVSEDRDIAIALEVDIYFKPLSRISNYCCSLFSEISTMEFITVNNYVNTQCIHFETNENMTVITQYN